MGMFDEKQLSNELGALSNRNRIAFAASCCERLVPHYRIFAFTEPNTEPNLLDDALSDIWTVVEDNQRPTDHLAQLQETIKAFIQALDKPGFLFASTAFNAASAVSYTAECCIGGEVRWSVFAARMAVETLDTYLYLVNAPFGEDSASDGDVQGLRHKRQAFDQWIQQSPLMIDELRKQNEDLEKLAANESPLPGLFAEMRQSSQKRGIQPQLRGMINLS